MCILSRLVRDLIAFNGVGHFDIAFHRVYRDYIIHHTNRCDAYHV